ncbi:MAG TPA: hypothetical protein PKY44_00590 [Bacteroidales bacterium]|nr:hypothetical protein [Bacteroidales bacterium]
MNKTEIKLILKVFKEINWDLVSSLYKMEHIDKYIYDFSFDNTEIIEKLQSELLFGIYKLIKNKSGFLQIENWIIIYDFNEKKSQKEKLDDDDKIIPIDDNDGLSLNKKSPKYNLYVYYTIAQSHVSDNDLKSMKDLKEINNIINNSHILDYDDLNENSEDELNALFDIISELTKTNIKNNKENDTKKEEKKQKSRTTNEYSNLKNKSIDELEKLLQKTINEENYEMSEKIYNIIKLKQNVNDQTK